MSIRKEKGIAEIAVVKKNAKKLFRILEVMERTPFQPNIKRGGVIETRLVQQWIQYTTKQSTLFFSSGAIAVSLGAAYPFLNRCRSSQIQDSKFAFGDLTFLNITYSPNYEITWIYQTLTVLGVGTNIIGITLITSGILAYISVQFQILNNFLRCIVVYSNKKAYKITQPLLTLPTTTTSWAYLKESLIEAITYFGRIVEIMEEMKDIFSLLLLAIYVCIIAIICIMIYQASLLHLSDPRAIRLLFQVGFALSEALLLCYWGEQVTFQSGEIGWAAYQTDFVGTDLRFQKMLAFIIRRSQNTMRIKSVNMVDTSLATFAWIVRASYSAFMFLRQNNSKRTATVD